MIINHLQASLISFSNYIPSNFMLVQVKQFVFIVYSTQHFILVGLVPNRKCTKHLMLGYLTLVLDSTFVYLAPAFSQRHLLNILHLVSDFRQFVSFFLLFFQLYLLILSLLLCCSCCLLVRFPSFFLALFFRSSINLRSFPTMLHNRFSSQPMPLKPLTLALPLNCPTYLNRNKDVTYYYYYYYYYYISFYYLFGKYRKITRENSFAEVNKLNFLGKEKVW